MIKNVAISIINAFYYLIFSIVFLAFTYVPSYHFHYLATILIISSLCSIIQWSVSLYQHVLIRTYFLKEDFLYRFFPLLLLIIAYPFKYNHYVLYMTPYLSFFIFAIPVILRYIDFFSSYPRKILKNIMNQLSVNTIFFYDTSMRFNWININNIVKNITKSSYYIVDNCYFDSEYISIYSGGKKIEYNYEKKYFVVDRIIISTELVQNLQKDYQLNFFDMSDEQFEIVKMIVI